MSIWSWDGIRPVIDPAAFVHPDATVIGDVIVGPAVYVGPGAVLRGDFGRIVLEKGCNVQETCVVHSFPGKDVVVGEAGIGENAIVAAMAFVKAGAQIPAGALAVGSPARVVRMLTGAEIDWKRRGTAIYQRLALEARDRLAPTTPLDAAEPGRKHAQAPDYDPLILDRAGISAPT